MVLAFFVWLSPLVPPTLRASGKIIRRFVTLQSASIRVLRLHTGVAYQSCSKLAHNYSPQVFLQCWNGVRNTSNFCRLQRMLTLQLSLTDFLEWMGVTQLVWLRHSITTHAWALRHRHSEQSRGPRTDKLVLSKFNTAISKFSYRPTPVLCRAHPRTCWCV